MDESHSSNIFEESKIERRSDIDLKQQAVRDENVRV